MKASAPGIFLFVSLICFVFSGCGDQQEILSLDITPRIRTDTAVVWSGLPLEIEYIWKVDKDPAALEGQIKIFVHFLDEEGSLVLSDDHFPERPVTSWKMGEVIRYSRTLYLPEFRTSGPIAIKAGCYHEGDPARRLALNGAHSGDYAYEIGTLTVEPKPAWSEVYFEDGWHSPETKPNRLKDRWIWSEGVSRIVTGNPKSDCTLFLDAHSPSRDMGEPQQIEIYLNDALLRSWVVSETRQDDIREKIDLPKDLLGDESWLHFKIKLDKTYIPAAHGLSQDTRELGLKVFHFVLKEKTAPSPEA